MIITRIMKEEEENRMMRDFATLSNYQEIRVKHLDWTIQDVNFQRKVLVARAQYTCEQIISTSSSTTNTTTTKTLDLDTSHLMIRNVTDQYGQKLLYELVPSPESKSHLGTKLSIQLANIPPRSSTTTAAAADTAATVDDNSMVVVIIEYETTPQSTAVQWLEPSQTSGKLYPYLFTQCQAIHARSLVPCQDIPQVKITYTAHVLVPHWATCVMSALLIKQQEEQDEEGKEIKENKMNNKIYSFEQRVPVSSYLIAMAIGQLTKYDISNRCAIWTEPGIIAAATYEFQQTEDFLQMAEQIAGLHYQWGRYDLLCLPPSFPYGGMENPCLTFVTPTLLAGDRSLADVVAHEIAHSWTGNLVTNRTWSDFWLNEGWTTWFQRKIMAKIKNDHRFIDFDAIGGYKSLQDCIQLMKKSDYTKLVLPLHDEDPDEAYSAVAYEKGFNLLYYLEHCIVGTTAFELFFQSYISHFANQTLSSNEFRDFFMNHFQGHEAIVNIDWETWFYSPGMPPIEPSFDRTLAEASAGLAIQWLDYDRHGTNLPDVEIQSWSSNQITCFLDAVLTETKKTSTPLQIKTLLAMNRQYNLRHTRNCEVLFRYCLLSVEAEDDTIVPLCIHFITSQGRMKYVRPLYRALSRSKIGSHLAISTFLEHKDFYHPICSKMIASDLLLSQPNKRSITGTTTLDTALIIGASATAAIAIVLGISMIRRRS